MPNKKSIVELVDRIEDLFDKKPDGRKKLELEDWKKSINQLIEIVNKETKAKIYNIQ
jgi:hypothetical protein